MIIITEFKKKLLNVVYLCGQLGLKYYVLKYKNNSLEKMRKVLLYFDVSMVLVNYYK